MPDNQQRQRERARVIRYHKGDLQRLDHVTITPDVPSLWNAEFRPAEIVKTDQLISRCDANMIDFVGMGSSFDAAEVFLIRSQAVIRYNKAKMAMADQSIRDLSSKLKLAMADLEKANKALEEKGKVIAEHQDRCAAKAQENEKLLKDKADLEKTVKDLTTRIGELVAESEDVKVRCVEEERRRRLAEDTVTSLTEEKEAMRATEAELREQIKALEREKERINEEKIEEVQKMFALGVDGGFAKALRQLTVIGPEVDASKFDLGMDVVDNELVRESDLEISEGGSRVEEGGAEASSRPSGENED